MTENNTATSNYSEIKDRLLFYEQVRLIYRQSISAIAASYVSVIILALILFNQVEFSRILSWFVVITVVMIFRIFNVIRYNRIQPGIDEVEKWGRYIYISSFFGGLAWGSSGIYLFPNASIPHQIFVLLMLGGLCSAVVATYSSLKWNVTIFSVFTLLPITFMFFVQNNDIQIYTGFVTFIYLSLVLASSFKVHSTIKKSFQLRIENIDLIAKLEDENIRSGILNDDLKKEIEEREKTEEQKEKLIVELQKAVKEISKLGGLLPICSACKKIRDDHGFWRQVEEYIASHTEAVFSHSICPECRDRLYPELKEDRINDGNDQKENL